MDRHISPTSAPGSPPDPEPVQRPEMVRKTDENRAKMVRTWSYFFSPGAFLRRGGGKIRSPGTTFCLRKRSTEPGRPTKIIPTKSTGPLRFFPRGYSAKGRGKNPNEQFIYLPHVSPAGHAAVTTPASPTKPTRHIHH